MMHLYELLANIEYHPEYKYRPHTILQDKEVMKDIDCEISFKDIKQFYGRNQTYHNNMCWVEFEDNDELPLFYTVVLSYSTLLKLENLRLALNAMLDGKKFKLILVFKRKYFHLEFQEV